MTMTEFAPRMLAASLVLAVGCSAAPERPETLAAEQAAAADPLVAGNRSADSALNLITRVKSATGSIVEFYEPTPGDVIISEAGGDGVLPVRDDLRKLMPTAVYQLVAPQLPVPDKLRDAELRLRQLASSSPTRASSAASAPAAPTTAPAIVNHTVSPLAVDPNAFCGRQWFTDNVNDASFDCSGSGAPFMWCQYDIGTGASAQGNNIYLDAAELCVAAGSGNELTVSRQGDDNSGGAWSMPSPSWRWFSHLAAFNLFIGYNHYNIQVVESGSWGDVQFAGHFAW